MEKFNRSERIFQKEKVVKARKNYWGKQKLSDKQLGILSKTPASCACWMCQNPRKSGMLGCERTIQELQQLDILDEQIRDLDI